MRGKFLPGARVKAPPEQSGGGGGTWGRPRAGRGRAHEEPARGRAGGAAWAGVGVSQTLCAPERAPGRRSCGATGPGAPPALRVGFVCSRVGSSPRGRGDLAARGRPGTPEPAFGTARSPDGRWLRARRGKAGRARQERRPRRHVPAGRAARAEGGGHGGDCAPPPIVPGLGLGPRAASPLAAPPLPRSLAGGRAGHKGRPACPEPRSARASAPPLAAQPPRNGRGESPRPARPGSDLPPPGGRAGTRRADCPLVRHVLPARAP